MPALSKKEISAFHHTLREWYAAHGRKDLPWRNTDDPYTIYLSEIMLQQTQVKTVLERFYGPFLEKFPNLASLSVAKEEDVLKAWEGLGYYSRARNLHKTAKQIAPELPKTIEELMALPGIGKNTAHAIATFAFHQPVPVMEANVKRVLCRLFALSSPSKKELWNTAHTLVDTEDPFTYNQAMMDIGSMICTPKTPQCDTCPASMLCRGKNTPEAYPEKKQKKSVPTRERLIIIAQDINRRIYVTPRESRFLGGMYQFIEVEPPLKIMRIGGREAGMTDLQYLGQIKHTYSHFKLEAKVYKWVSDRLENSQNWIDYEEVPSLPLSKADQKALALFTRSSL